jgi:hypothetical protein
VRWLESLHFASFVLIWFCGVSGQGTVGVEFLEQVQDLDVIVVPISGKHPQSLRYVALLWALPTPHTKSDCWIESGLVSWG